MRSKDKPDGGKLPKGAYRLPTGGYVTESRGLAGKRMIIIRAVHKDPPDLDKLARALIQLADQMNKEEQERQQM